MKTRFQRGTLFKYSGKRGEMWKGRFRVGTFKSRKESWITLGPVNSMTEDEARKALDGIIAKADLQTASVTHFGLNGIIQAAVHRPDNATMKPGRFRGSMGALSELLVCADLLTKGLECFKAVSPQSSCDLLCITPSGIVRVEVKTEVLHRSGKGFCDVAHNEGNFDVLALVHRDGRITYTPAINIDSRLFQSSELCGIGWNSDGDNVADLAATPKESII